MFLLEHNVMAWTGIQ